MRMTSLPYSIIENGKLVSVPGMTAHVCDVCGHRDFDREAVKRLFLMLGAARRRRRKSSAERTTPPTAETPPTRAARTPRPKKS